MDAQMSGVGLCQLGLACTVIGRINIVKFNFSVFAGAGGASLDLSELGGVLDGALHDLGGTDRWEVATGGLWCAVTPHGYVGRSQGWKLHLSATVSSAKAVLARAVPLLLEGGCAFKFASTLAHVAQLNARNTPRGHSGKFITVYPESDEDAVGLAEALHQATVGLAGPRILSDRPYAPGSLVHYRYGAFVEARRLSNDGLYTWVILDPEGNPVEDRRVGQYLPPEWVRCPFPDPVPTGVSGTGSGKGGVLIGDRFLVREAIRHVNKGGVYRAVDSETGADVILKEARPHVAADDTGKDVRDMLRAEARALERIGSLGAAPRMLLLFEQSEHLFLAEELVPGVSLREWVLDRIRHGGWRRHVPGAWEMAERLVELMDVAHSAGLILRDFNPNNIMVRPDGQLRLIDLELTVLSGEQEKLMGAGTPGYGAPEQMQGGPAAVAADYYSLGATICFVVTGSTPDFVADAPKARPLRERLAEWLAVRRASDSSAAIYELILGLMDDEPRHRWTTVQAQDALAAARKPEGRGRRTQFASGHGLGSDDVRLDDQLWRQVLEGSVGYLLASMNPDDDERLWPVSCAHGAADPCAIQLGAAGVLGVLTRYFVLTGDQRLPKAITTAGEWIDQRLQADRTRSPGLYFGQAGIAWSLYEAGRALGDDRLAGRGLALADTLPVSSDNPDLTHGTAGIGLTFLHLWLRTNNENLAQRASQSADELIASASEEPSGISWGTPAAFESLLAGGRYHGFAHGTAGVGYVLLAMALATGRSDCLELAYRAGETLLENAIINDGVAQWGAGPDDDPTAPYWCHGSAGIGTFLIRLHRATGDDRFIKLADMSAQAVMENSWRGVLGQCHGLAGNGDFLLDMAQTANGQQYHIMAHQLARIILASRAYHHDHIVFPDERGNPSPVWADGVSGILAFLLRLRHHSPRLWMIDPPHPRNQP
ncbi:MAG: class IV lanthionine synthetase LanL [Pseudonocardiaceae bacterium]